jgi:hypothetical protein
MSKTKVIKNKKSLVILKHSKKEENRFNKILTIAIYAVQNNSVKLTQKMIKKTINYKCDIKTVIDQVLWASLYHDCFEVFVYILDLLDELREEYNKLDAEQKQLQDNYFYSSLSKMFNKEIASLSCLHDGVYWMVNSGDDELNERCKKYMNELVKREYPLWSNELFFKELDNCEDRLEEMSEELLRKVGEI